MLSNVKAYNLCTEGGMEAIEVCMAKAGDLFGRRSHRSSIAARTKRL